MVWFRRAYARARSRRRAFGARKIFWDSQLTHHSVVGYSLRALTYAPRRNFSRAFHQVVQLDIKILIFLLHDMQRKVSSFKIQKTKFISY